MELMIPLDTAALASVSVQRGLELLRAGFGVPMPEPPAPPAPAPAQPHQIMVRVRCVWPLSRGHKVDCQGGTGIVWTGHGDVQPYPAAKWHLLDAHPDVWELEAWPRGPLPQPPDLPARPPRPPRPPPLPPPRAMTRPLLDSDRRTGARPLSRVRAPAAFSGGAAECVLHLDGETMLRLEAIEFDPPDLEDDLPTVELRRRSRRSKPRPSKMNLPTGTHTCTTSNPPTTPTPASSARSSPRARRRRV